MKLSLKIAGAVGTSTLVLVLAMSAFSIRRDLAIIDEDLARDARLVATSIATSVEGHSESEVREVIRRIEEDSPEISIRLLPHDEAPTQARDSIRARVDLPFGILEVEEDLAIRERLLAASLRSLGLMCLFVLVVSLVGGHIAGRLVIGRRIDLLIRKAQRLSEGRFEEPVDAGTDELGALGAELNRTAGQLSEARRAAASEAESRLEAEVQLRHADRLRTVGQVAAGMAHELGTPLNVISGRATLLTRALQPSEATHGHAIAIQEQTDHITQIVRRLMDYSRATPLEQESLDLAVLVRDTLEMVGATMTANGTTVEAHGIQRARVRGDAEQLRQVVTNLLMNAAQAAAGGRVRVRLWSDAQANLRVEDDGPGVPVPMRDRVVEPFYTTKDPGEGTGLGLSIVTTIVDEHGGRLDIEASDLGGASFTVVLPLESTP